MLTPWLDNYKVREWTTTTLPIEQYTRELKPLLRACDDLEVIAAESPMAQELWNRGVREGLFYFDVEQILGMDLNGRSGGDIYYLTCEYEGHPANTLVYVLYKGIENMLFTIGFAE